MTRLANLVMFAFCVVAAIYTHDHGLGSASDALTAASVAAFLAFPWERHK